MWGLKRLKWASPRADAATASQVENPAAKARRLADAGHYREAIDLLAAEDPDSLDVDSLCDLVLWRHAAFNPEPGLPSWPPRFIDPFPGVQGPPEIQIGDLTADILGGAIQHHGCLLVRGMIDDAQVRQLSSVVGSAFETAGAMRAAPGAAARSPWYAPYPLSPNDEMTQGGREFATSCGAIWTADAPRALADFIAFLGAHGVSKVIEAYLGERAFLSLGKATLRVVPPTTGTNWHQDGAFLGKDIRTVNVWLALSDCGEDASGLDIYPERMTGLVETGTKGAMASWTVGEWLVEEMLEGRPVITPVFKAGDAMLFDQMLLHRTGVHPGMTKERLAIETWFFAGSTFPMKQIPIAI